MSHPFPKRSQLFTRHSRRSRSPLTGLVRKAGLSGEESTSIPGALKIVKAQREEEYHTHHDLPQTGLLLENT